MQEVDKKTDQDIRREGLFARAVGRLATANPYLSNSPEGILWEEGWRMIDKDSDPYPTRSFSAVPDFTPASAQPSGREGQPARPFPVVDMIFIAAAVVALVIGITLALLR